jgi:hypothetical protein
VPVGWSGLIYAAIVAGWAAVLVPRWVRRNEEAERARAADVLAGVRVIERRRPDGVEPRPSRPSRLHALHTPHPPLPDIPLRSRRTARRETLPARPGAGAPRPTGSAAARRRRVFVILVAVVAVTMVAVVTDVLPGPVIGLPLALLLGFVLIARQSVRREARAARRTRARSALDAAGPEVVPARSRAAVATVGERRARSVAPAARRTAAAPPPPVREGNIDPAVAEAGPAGAAAVDGAGADELDHTDSWAPVPVPLPTYVTAPKAPPLIRRIDLSSSRAWTSGGVATGDMDGPPARAGQETGSAQEATDFPELPPVLGRTGAELDGVSEPDQSSDDPDGGYEQRRAVGD